MIGIVRLTLGNTPDSPDSPDDIHARSGLSRVSGINPNVVPTTRPYLHKPAQTCANYGRAHHREKGDSDRASRTLAKQEDDGNDKYGAMETRQDERRAERWLAHKELSPSLHREFWRRRRQATPLHVLPNASATIGTYDTLDAAKHAAERWYGDE